jgi:tetratricopeptide (TPR) repeat protein
MIMPFGRKATGAEAGRGPAEIDFNALWDRCYVPVIEGLGYDAVRADQDTGVSIISQMLERLYFADLVLADMTIPNGNVYYEVGIRHAAKQIGCVLLAADWSRRLFDVAQMRTLNYPLAEGDITEETALAFRAAVKDKIVGLSEGESPMYETIKGYPAAVNRQAASTMKAELAQLAAFQTKVRAVRAAPRPERMRLAQQLIAEDGNPPTTYPVALALMGLLRDSVERTADWAAVREFVGKLPARFANEPDARELLAFAIGKAGDNAQAIAALQTLVAGLGPTPERLGLLGGRYKRLVDSASDGEKQVYLAQAIESYEKGMDLDLNAYYCSSNLPRLYRERGDEGDEERAQIVGQIAVAACERAERLNLTDEWRRATLLGAAFDVGNADKAEKLARQVAVEGAARWKLDSTLADLKVSVRHVKDDAQRARLLAVIAKLDVVNGGGTGAATA